MDNYTYQNSLVNKKQLKQLLSWSFKKYGSIKSCLLADKLKHLGFKYATKAGISISIEDLRVPSIKNLILENANYEIVKAEKVCAKGKITDVERFQKIIDTWNFASEDLKNELVSYFKKYDPLNSVYIMAFSGARGNLSQVRQLIGMRGLMSDPNGEIMNLPIKKNFREGLTITDYLMSGYGARKGIVDTALKTANSGYLTRRLIDVAQDIIIREKDCLTTHSFLFLSNDNKKDLETLVYNRIIGRLLNKPVYDLKTNELLAEVNTQITVNLIRLFKNRNIKNFYIRSPLTCCLYRSICQKCYGWDLSTENLVDMGEAVGIIAGQSIGEPGTQLTMRTFHTGGIFTSEASKQLISSINGTVEFSTVLKTLKLRTNRGENVLLTESSGSLIILSDSNPTENIQFELPRNTILFVNNKQFVKKNTIIGQLRGNIKQIKNETKYIVSETSGEIYVPRLKNKTYSTKKNKLLWVLSGQVYQAPMNSFLNFYSDHKINKNSYIFRSKLLNKEPGYVQIIENNNKLQQAIEIFNTSNLFLNSNVYRLSNVISNKSYLLNAISEKYLVDFQVKNNKLILPVLPIKNFATLITNKFLTLTGGKSYYNIKLYQKNYLYNNKLICYLKKIQKISYRSLIWLNEETYDLNCNSNLLTIKNEIFIQKNSELIPNLFSKTSGFVDIIRKNNIIQQILVKSGSFYDVENIRHLKMLDQRLFYPGETILKDIKISAPSICQVIKFSSSYKLLIQPLCLYEVPISLLSISTSLENRKENSIFCTNSQYRYSFNSGELIKDFKNLQVIVQSTDLNLKNVLQKKENIEIEIINNKKENCLDVNILEKRILNQYVPTNLKYKNIQSCLTIENNQYIDGYTMIGYLESITNQELELVKLKSKRKLNKQIFLISNNDCITIKKQKVKNKTINDLILNNVNITQTGKVLIDNKKTLTIQKGRPYFIPNCEDDGSIDQTSLKYRFFDSRTFSLATKFNNVHINYYDITKRLPYYKIAKNIYEKFESSRILIKKKGKSYTSGVPIFVREFLINKNPNSKSKLATLNYKPWFGYLDYKDKIYKTKKQYLLPYLDRVRLDNVFFMLMKSSELVLNKSKKSYQSKSELASISLLEHPLKTIGIHSITEDYLEQENNSLYGENGEFIEKDQIIGLVNFEKEITGDIVQGLPRIEELLEARKKKRASKHMPKSQKKGLLIRKTSIDPNFEFRKLGNQIKENEKINPHNLIKIYFNYYAKVKYFNLSNKNIIKLCRLTNNYEASYRSFKKIQLLILNSVQSVYSSQGVTISDKHLEVIIKQMTTKVLITQEGDTPLLPREVIDLYHIKYINRIVNKQSKRLAYYVPLLLGITKAALNNPSFISAASFQETTKVLTKAAIEGRLDWLRGLKENIIIGHLIPAGTGSKTYVNSFKNTSSNKSTRISSLENIKKF